MLLPIISPVGLINLILSSNISSCKSLSLKIFLGAESLSQVLLIINANGLSKLKALLNISALFVNGGIKEH